MNTQLSPYAIPGLPVAKKKAITPEIIIGIVCEEMQIPVDEFHKNHSCRKQHYTFARYIAAYLLKKECKLSFNTIGWKLMKNHATIIHNINQVNNAIQTNYQPILQPLASIQKTLKKAKL